LIPPQSARNKWIELAVDVDNEAVESVVELFSRFGYNEGVVIEEPFVQDLDGDNLAVDPSRPFTVRTFIAATSFNGSIRGELEKTLWHLGQLRFVGRLLIQPRAEDDWANAWKAHFVPVRVGDRTVIRPPWHDYTALPGEIVVTLDPGMAFGTGTHPSTQICLRQIERHIFPGSSVLDVGTGSGVLAIAAALLGASTVDAYDIEPVAVRQARENVELNGVSHVVSVGKSDMKDDDAPPGLYDLVFANIIARILVELSVSIATAAKPGGVVILGGIIESRESLVIDCYRGAGLSLMDRERVGDWVGQVWKKPV
jgi:ribosomal protein L11 methyltransferase